MDSHSWGNSSPPVLYLVITAKEQHKDQMTIKGEREVFLKLNYIGSPQET